jgi:hypothetical protein
VFIPFWRLDMTRATAQWCSNLLGERMKEPEKHGFMDNRSYPNMSRDWEEIECENERCEWQMAKQCTVPSLAKIGEDGRCVGFKPRGTLAVKKETPP